MTVAEILLRNRNAKTIHLIGFLNELGIIRASEPVAVDLAIRLTPSE